MKKILVLLFLFVSILGYSQKVNQTLGNKNTIIRTAEIRIDSVIRAPLDTLASAPDGSVAYKGGLLYYKSTYWYRVGKFYLAGNGLTLTDSTFRADTSILSTKANRDKLRDSLGTAFIQNQSASNQSASFKISGTGYTLGDFTTGGVLYANRFIGSTVGTGKFIDFNPLSGGLDFYMSVSSGFRFYNSSGVNYLESINGASGFSFGTQTGEPIYFRIGSTVGLTVAADGSTLIGNGATTNGTGKLQVYGGPISWPLVNGFFSGQDGDTYYDSSAKNYVGYRNNVRDTFLMTSDVPSLDISAVDTIYTDFPVYVKTGSYDTLAVDTSDAGLATRWWVRDTLSSFGAGTLNANIGSGFLILKPAGQEIKSLFNGYAIAIDSSTNTNGLTLKADTSLLSTKAFRDKLKDSIGVILGNYQPLDADLTAISALSGTNTIYYRSASNTWSAVTYGHELLFGSSKIGFNKAVQSLTDGATITWDLDDGFNGAVTITADRTLSVTNVEEGDYGTIAITQDGTGGHSITVTDGTVTLDQTAGATTVIGFYYDGSTFYWNGGYQNPVIDIYRTVGVDSIYAVYANGDTLAIKDSTGAGASDHGALTGLTDDDHTQYALLAGRSGGQTLKGGTASGDDLTLSTTNDATKGDFIFGTTSKMVFDEVNTELRLGSSTDQGAYQLQVATHSVFGYGAAQASMNFTNNSNTTGYSQLAFTMANGTSLGSLTGYDASHGATLGGVSTNSLLSLGAGAGNLLLFSFGGGNVYFWAGTSASADMSLKATGRLGLKGITSPDAFLHLPAGTTTTPQLKLNASTVLTTTQAGAVEYDGTNLFFSAANSGPRFKLDRQNILTTNTTDVANVGTGEDNLMSYTIPAGQLATNHDNLEFVMEIGYAANTDGKVIKVYYGASNILTLPSVTAGAGGTVTIRGTIIRTGAATQKISVTYNSNVVGLESGSGYAETAETLSGTVVLKATGEATSNGDIQQRILNVKYYAN